jgi:hypothetical protein
MKNKSNLAAITVGLMFLIPFATPALAVEGALGRPISGAAINPYAGLVPPEPGLAAVIGEAYYDGSNQRRRSDR